MMQLRFFILLFAMSSLAQAQFNLGFREVEGSITFDIDGQLSMPTVGGFNTPQFSAIDLNGDGTDDLFVFDRANDVIRTFVYENGAYSYAPRYEQDFPDDLQEFALLRDFNCDGKADIFTFYQAGFRVYKNNSSGANLSFEKVTDEVESDYGVIETAAFVLSGDIPAIVDIDNDGDLDILTFGTVNSENTIEFHRNLSMDLYGNCDSLDYEVVTQCWGNVQEPAEADSLVTYNCKGVVPPGGRGDRHHPGSTVLLIDTDNDNDKDLILGDIQTNRALFAVNAGDVNTATIDVNQQSHDFPNAQNPVRMQYLVAGYEVDIDHDGIQDLLMTVNNTIDSSVNAGHVWQYRNGSSGVVDYSLVTKEFLIGEMVDLGANTSPQVMDVNGDGRQDILVASDYIRTPTYNHRSRIYLFEQQSDGAFELTDDDYAGISFFGFQAANFCLGDMDDDGDLDMMLGDAAGELHYFRNDPVAGVANFTLVGPIYMGINTIGSNAAPAIVDVNLDGLPDLLVGERIGTISYFENEGSATNAFFNPSPTVEDFGGIDVSVQCCAGYSVPRVIESPAFGEGRFLFVGSGEKRIDIYALPGETNLQLTKLDSLYLNAGRLAPVTADFDGDGIHELLCGTAEGGLKHYSRDENYMVGSELAEHVKMRPRLFPNPARSLVQLQLDAPFSGIVSVIDVHGREVQSKILQNALSSSFEVSSLPSGTYVFRFMGEEFTHHERVLILQAP